MYPRLSSLSMSHNSLLAQFLLKSSLGSATSSSFAVALLIIDDHNYFAIPNDYPLHSKHGLEEEHRAIRHGVIHIHISPAII